MSQWVSDPHLHCTHAPWHRENTKTDSSIVASFFIFRTITIMKDGAIIAILIYQLMQVLQTKNVINNSKIKIAN